MSDIDVDTDEIEIIHNQAEQRFEVELAGKLAVLEYTPRGSRIAYTHTEVPDEMEGQGVGGALAKHALEYARAQGLEVLPICPFVAAYIRRHREYQDLVARGRRDKDTA